jgi:glycosyltransferase involved in cell wall biosynthesis
MIYLDVTSAAASSLNAGVQRAARGIHRHLHADSEVCPVRWDFSAKCYALLSPREYLFLTDPFGSDAKPVSIPLLNGLASTGALSDRWSRRARGLRLATFLKPGDLLLIPDLCWDSRIRSWSKLARLPGRKVAIFHDAMPLRIRGQAHSNDELYAQYVRELAQLDLVICISEEVEQDLLRFWCDFGITAKPTVVLPWPMPFTGGRPDNRPNPAARRLIYVGGLRSRKNHLILLEACECLWREGITFSLDLIGQADAFTDAVKIVIRVAALRSRGHAVRWLKHVSEIELGRAYQECSFTVYPSKMEGFGLPIIESLWHIRPVICGRNGAIGEIAAGGGCLQIDQNNVVELAGAMRELLTDESAYDRLYAEARARIFRTWDDYGRDLEAVLEPAVR